MTTTGKQLFTTLESDGTLTVEIAQSEFPDPTGNQVLVKMEAAPINPSDLAILTGAADFENADYSPGKVVAKMPEPFNSGQKARHGQRLPAGNEGAGTVVATGDSDMAKALMGQRVACVPGTAFSEYAIADAAMCLPLGDHSAEAGASSFVNPMTALGFVENAKMDGQKAILHTVGASNLGQMLNRICLEDGMGLVNIVRKDEQAKLLKEQDAGADTPEWAYGAIYYSGPGAEEYTPSIVALLSRLTGDVDPDAIIEYAAGELTNLPGWEPLSRGRTSTLSGFPAYQLGGTWVQDGVTKVVAQKTAVIPGADGLYVLQLNADGLESQLDIIGPATDIIDDQTVITP